MWNLSDDVLFLSLSFSVFLQLHLWPMDVPSLGMELELQLLVYTMAQAILDP